MTEHLAADLAGITQACELLDAGATVAFPTETVYGLGGDATNPRAVAEIFAAKGRPAFNPLISHVSDIAAAEREGIFNDVARRLAETFWPGPLTLVLPLAPSATTCELARAGLNSIALRCPDHPVALALLDAFGRPLAGPSANVSGHVSPTSPAHVLADLSGKIAAVIEGGSTRVGIESTIVACIDDRLHLLRPGFVTREALATVAGIDVSEAAEDGHAPLSPGRLASHYAPRTKVRLNASDVGETEVLLAFGDVTIKGAETARYVLNLSPLGDLTQAASNLYAHLRDLDAHAASAIAVASLPNSGLGEAIMDRLRRAAAEATLYDQTN